MARSERGRPAEPIPDDEDDITAARRIAHQGTTDTRSRLTQRQRQLALGIVAAIVLVLLANASVTIYLGQQLSTQAVERADEKRTNGEAQAQARQALADAQPANQTLRQRGLFAIPIQGPDKSPSFAVIANSATAQVIADMPREAVLAGDFIELGKASQRYYQRNPRITASGPDPLQVNQLGVLYLLVAKDLAQKGMLR